VEQAAKLDYDGVLHALFNNAGVVGLQQSYIDHDIEEWHRVLNIDLNGVLYGLKYGLAQMVKQAEKNAAQESDDPNFAMVNRASTAAFRGLPNIGPYTATKWAVRGMIMPAAMENAQYKIRVNAIAPTDTETDMIRQFVASSPDPEKVLEVMQAMNALPGFPQPVDMAAVCAFLLNRS